MVADTRTCDCVLARPTKRGQYLQETPDV